MPSRKVQVCPQAGHRTWIRDCLHDLRDYAQSEGLKEADTALRSAIIAVSKEAGIATLLSVEELIAYQEEEAASRRGERN